MKNRPFFLKYLYLILGLLLCLAPQVQAQSATNDSCFGPGAYLVVLVGEEITFDVCYFEGEFINPDFSKYKWTATYSWSLGDGRMVLPTQEGCQFIKRAYTKVGDYIATRTRKETKDGVIVENKELISIGYHVIRGWDKCGKGISGGGEDNKNINFIKENGCPNVGMPLISINTSNLNMLIEDIDSSYSGRRPIVSIKRTYNANDYGSSIFGNKWTFNYGIWLQENLDGSVYLFRGSGKKDIFQPDSLGGYISQEGVYDILIKNSDNTWSLRIKDKKTTQNFNENGNLTSIIDHNNNAIIFQYTGVFTHPSESKLSSITDAAGRVYNFTYENDRVIQITDPLGRTASYNYDGNGNLVSTTDMEGNTVTYSYDANSYITSITTPKGTTTLTYTTSSGDFALASLTNPDGITKTYGFQDNDYRVKITDGNGNSTYYDNTAEGYTENVTDALGNKLTYTYTNGNRTKITDANGNVTSMAYDSRGNLTQVTNPMGRTISYEYDGNNNLTKLTDAEGHVITYTYDGNNNLTATSNPATAFTYNSHGELTSTTDALGNTTTFSYDSSGNLLSIANAKGEVPYTYTYDAVSRLTQTTDSHGNATGYQYDGIDRTTKITYPIGVQQFTYQCCGLTSKTDEEGKTTQYTYKPTDGLTAQNLASVTDALGGITKYGYDSAGNMVSVTNAANNSITYSYDAADRLARDADNTIYSYDPAGNILAKTDANGNTIRYTYDRDNRLITTTYPDSSQVNFTYSDNGNLTSMSDASGTTSYSYSFIAGRNRLGSKTDPYGKTIQYGYDVVGNLTPITYPDGNVVSYTYDELNRLITVTDWLGHTTTYTYAFENYLDSVIYPNGVTTTYGYDSRWRLTSLVTNKANGEVIASYIYTLDGVGNRITVDRIDPLSSAPFLDNTTYTHNAANQVLSANGTNAATFAYDNNGNLTSKTIASKTTSYSYDYEDRLTQISANGSSTQYIYDGLGNRIAKIVNGTTTHYVVDTNNALSQILAETDGSGNITAYYVYGLGLLAKITPAGDAYYYHYEGLGSTVAMTDSSQNIVNKYAYDPYGKILNSSETVANAYKFVGKFGVMDEGDNLYFMRARYYDAGTKRFTQKDPLWGDKWEPGSFNRYVYVGGNPMIKIDPHGLDAVLIATLAELLSQGQEFQRDLNTITQSIEEAYGIKNGLDYETKWEKQEREELKKWEQENSEFIKQVNENFRRNDPFFNFLLEYHQKQNCNY